MNGETPGPSPETEEIMPEVPETEERRESGIDKKETEDAKVEEEDNHREGLKQEEKDQERIEEIRSKLQEAQTTNQFGQEELTKTSPPQKEQDFPSKMVDLGLKLSNSISRIELEETAREVVTRLSDTYPRYNLQERLSGIDKNVFLASDSSLNQHLLEREGGRTLFSRLRSLEPLRVGGWRPKGENGVVLSGLLPRFLTKRVLYHEVLHAASRGKFYGLDEGATEYFATGIRGENNFLDRLVNPAYLMKFLTFQLMAKTVGEKTAQEAYFGGDVENFKRELDQKWGNDSFNSIINGSWGIGVPGFALALFKYISRRGN